MRVSLLSAFALWVFGAGCTLSEVDLSSKSCPCAVGWRCDEPAGRCVPDGPADAGPGGDDGGSRDAGGRDASTDGAPGDAAALPDADPDGGWDAGPDPTACDDIQADALFCDGFEDETLAVWETFDRYGSHRLDPDTAQRGLLSYHAEATRENGKVVVRSDVIDVVEGDLYMRAWVNVPGDVELIGGFGVMQLGQAVLPYHHVQVGVSADGRTELELRTSATPTTATGALFPRDTWVCLEVHVEVADAGGRARFWLDGALQNEIGDADTLPLDGYQRHNVGVASMPAGQTAARVYVDEVVVDDEPIGC